MNTRPFWLCLFIACSFFSTASAQPLGSRSRDLSRDPVLYTVGYAHLDTQWRWDYEETVNDFLKATLDDNFMRFEKYPGYVFTFSGARRYRMMKEYYPERYAKLKRYIAANRWHVGGSSVDECDVNVPSPESVIRQVLYGNAYFNEEYGKTSVDFLLPDCFGFQAWLPSALHHAGVKGFSTQKLEWGSANGIPFNIGNWNGPDGKGVIAALNATNYTGKVEPGLDTARYWVERVMENGNKYGVFADYRYYGVGDVGGAPRETDIVNAIAAATSPDPKIRVFLSSSDQLFRDLSGEQAARLPSYSGDLLLTEHSAGSLTSQAAMKRWNRKNEKLAAAAEPLAIMSDWLGAIPYPAEQLHEAWWTVLGSQMHDILPGTSIPSAYEYAWNDEVIALNRFASVLQASAGAVIRGMDTQVKGKAVAVYNPLSISREDLVEATLEYPDGIPGIVMVFDPAGAEIPCQILAKSKTSLTIVFPASVPALGVAVYDIRSAETAGKARGNVIAGSNFLENESYKVVIDLNGDIISIIDKKLNREILSGPVRLVFQKEHPDYWPAWNMDWKDRKEPPAGFVGGPAVISLVEKGPVRASFRIEREARNSKFITTVSLATGEAGQRIEIRNKVIWQSAGVSLKACFPLKAKNSLATYNMGLGAIERNNNHEKKYEVPSREWFDLTDRSGTHGVTILEDCKFGSDKPNDSTLRLTLLYTPVANAFHDQATQDWGIHDFTYCIYSHKGDWRTGQSVWQGSRLNQPLIAFHTPSHTGQLGKTWSFARLNTAQAGITAVKRSESGDHVVFRIQELSGKRASGVELILPAKALSAWEADGQEQGIKELAAGGTKLTLELEPYAVKTLLVRLEPAAIQMHPPVSYPQVLLYNWDVVSSDKNRKNGSLPGSGLRIPAELFPAAVTLDGVRFELGGSADNQFNVVRCEGQKISLPKTGNFNKIYILAAAEHDTTVTFRVGGQKKNLRIQPVTGKIGQFENRRWDKLGRIVHIEPGYIHRDPVAWCATHLHNDTANLPYQFGYLFSYELDAGPGSESLQLPDNPSVMIFALTLAENPFDQITPAAPLYDDFTGRETMTLRTGKRYTGADAVPSVRIEAERKRKLEELTVRVTMKDYADIHMPNGVTASYVSGKGTTQPVPALNDGMYDLLPDDSLKDGWHTEGEGRILMDLQRSIDIDSLHLFASAVMSRGPVRFSLWGLSEGTPALTGDPAAAGWSFMGHFVPMDIWGNAKAGYRVISEKPNRFRYLMWVPEESGYGPCLFREIDVFEKQH